MDADTDRLTTALARAAGGDPTAALARRADAEGLLDVAYDVIDSPVGPLLGAATPEGLVLLHFARDGVDAALEEVARVISPRVLRHAARLDQVRHQLDEYFAGRRRTFDLDLDWRLVRSVFGRSVLDVTNRIPYGRVRTYSEVAADAGKPAAARAAGNALGANPLPIVVPCHRVVRSGGGFGNYGGGRETKVQLLTLEGVAAA